MLLWYEITNKSYFDNAKKAFFKLESTITPDKIVETIL